MRPSLDTSDPITTLKKCASERKIESTFSDQEDLSFHYLKDIDSLLKKCKENNVLLNPKVREKLMSLMKALNYEQINIKSIRGLCFEGLPDICRRLRPICWRILLNYLPTERRLWLDTTKTNKNQYESFIQNYMQSKAGKFDPGKDIYTLM